MAANDIIDLDSDSTDDEFKDPPRKPIGWNYQGTALKEPEELSEPAAWEGQEATLETPKGSTLNPISNVENTDKIQNATPNTVVCSVDDDITMETPKACKPVARKSLGSALEIPKTCKPVAVKSLGSALEIPKTRKPDNLKNQGSNLEGNKTCNPVGPKNQGSTWEIPKACKPVAVKSLGSAVEIPKAYKPVAVKSLGSAVEIPKACKPVAQKSLGSAVEIPKACKPVALKSLGSAVELPKSSTLEMPKTTFRPVVQKKQFSTLQTPKRGKPVGWKNQGSTMGPPKTFRPVGRHKQVSALEAPKDLLQNPVDWSNALEIPKGSPLNPIVCSVEDRDVSQNSAPKQSQNSTPKPVVCDVVDGITLDTSKRGKPVGWKNQGSTLKTQKTFKPVGRQTRVPTSEAPKDLLQNPVDWSNALEIPKGSPLNPIVCNVEDKDLSQNSTHKPSQNSTPKPVVCEVDDDITLDTTKRCKPIGWKNQVSTMGPPKTIKPIGRQSKVSTSDAPKELLPNPGDWSNALEIPKGSPLNPIVCNVDDSDLSQSSASKPSQNSAPKSSQNSAPKLSQNSAPKSSQNSASKLSQNSAPKPSQNSAPKPSQNSAPKPVVCDVDDDITLDTSETCQSVGWKSQGSTLVAAKPCKPTGQKTLSSTLEAAKGSTLNPIVRNDKNSNLSQIATPTPIVCEIDDDITLDTSKTCKPVGWKSQASTLAAPKTSKPTVLKNQMPTLEIPKGSTHNPIVCNDDDTDTSQNTTLEPIVCDVDDDITLDTSKTSKPVGWKSQGSTLAAPKAVKPVGGKSQGSSLEPPEDSTLNPIVCDVEDTDTCQNSMPKPIVCDVDDITLDTSETCKPVGWNSKGSALEAPKDLLHELDLLNELIDGKSKGNTVEVIKEKGTGPVVQIAAAKDIGSLYSPSPHTLDLPVTEKPVDWINDDGFLDDDNEDTPPRKPIGWNYQGRALDMMKDSPVKVNGTVHTGANTMEDKADESSDIEIVEESSVNLKPKNPISVLKPRNVGAAHKIPSYSRTEIRQLVRRVEQSSLDKFFGKNSSNSANVPVKRVNNEHINNIPVKRIKTEYVKDSVDINKRNQVQDVNANRDGSKLRLRRIKKEKESNDTVDDTIRKKIEEEKKRFEMELEEDRRKLEKELEEDRRKLAEEKRKIEEERKKIEEEKKKLEMKKIQERRQEERLKKSEGEKSEVDKSDDYSVNAAEIPDKREDTIDDEIRELRELDVAEKSMDEESSETSIACVENFMTRWELLKTGGDDQKIKDRIWKHYYLAHSTYTHSRKFITLMKSSTKRLTMDNIYLVVKDILDHLKHYKDHPYRTKIEGEHSSTSALLEETPEDARRNKKLKKIDKKLKQISDKIRELEEGEIDLSDEDNSSYLMEDRLKRQFNRLHDYYCKIAECTSSTGRPIEKKFRYTGSRYEEVNRRISTWVNKTKEFPDYVDILNLVKKVTKDSCLPLRPETVRVQAQEIFRDVGRLLKDRRESDDLYCIYSRVEDPDKDPAAKDEELAKRLDQNMKVAMDRLDNIFQSYVEKEADTRQAADIKHSPMKEEKKKLQEMDKMEIKTEVLSEDDDEDEDEEEDDEDSGKYDDVEEEGETEGEEEEENEIEEIKVDEKRHSVYPGIKEYDDTDDEIGEVVTKAAIEEFSEEDDSRSGSSSKCDKRKTSSDAVAVTEPVTKKAETSLDSVTVTETVTKKTENSSDAVVVTEPVTKKAENSSDAVAVTEPVTKKTENSSDAVVLTEPVTEKTETSLDSVAVTESVTRNAKTSSEPVTKRAETSLDGVTVTNPVPEAETSNASPITNQVPKEAETSSGAVPIMKPVPKEIETSSDTVAITEPVTKESDSPAVPTKPTEKRKLDEDFTSQKRPCLAVLNP